MPIMLNGLLTTDRPSIMDFLKVGYLRKLYNLHTYWNSGIHLTVTDLWKDLFSTIVCAPNSNDSNDCVDFPFGAVAALFHYWSQHLAW